MSLELQHERRKRWNEQERKKRLKEIEKIVWKFKPALEEFLGTKIVVSENVEKDK